MESADTDRWGEPPLEWHDARLEALGRGEEAQAVRWARFEAALSEGDLRAQLARPPDFDDVEAEERALDHADVRAALAFLVRWPAIDRATAPALTRADELDGHACRVLTPTAEAPATLALRAVIDLALGEARSSRHRHAARLLAGCAELAPRVAGWRAVVPHDLHLAGLHAGHGRKAGLWAAVEDAAGR